MKKIKALMVAFVLAGMTVVSCSSDDSPGPVPTIEGKWNQEKTVVTVNNQSITNEYKDNVSGCDKNYFEFAPAKVFNEVVYYKAAGSGACEPDAADPGTWVKNDNMLTITASADISGTYEIVRLTSSELQVKITKNIAGINSIAVIYLRKAQ